MQTVSGDATCLIGTRQQSCSQCIFDIMESESTRYSNGCYLRFLLIGNEVANIFLCVANICTTTMHGWNGPGGGGDFVIVLPSIPVLFRFAFYQISHCMEYVPMYFLYLPGTIMIQPVLHLIWDWLFSEVCKARHKMDRVTSLHSMNSRLTLNSVNY